MASDGINVRSTRSLGVDPELVGRDAEAAEIEGFIDDTRTLPAALILQGDAGIGKTTLWRHGVAAAERRGHRVFATTGASSEVRLAFAALGDLLEHALDCLDLLPDPQRHALEVALLLADPGTAPPDPRAIALAALGLFRRAVADRPVLIAIDDAQWLDPASTGVLAFALRRLPDDEQIRVLVGQRAAHRDVPPPLDLDRALGDRAKRLLVEPLGLDALDRILRSRLGLTLARSTVRKVRHACADNPFFALEIGSVPAARGTPLDPSAPLPIPGNMHELLTGRLRAMTPAAREALLAAAAATEAKVDLIESISSSAGVEEALSAGVIVLDGPRVRFTHPLLSYAVYGQAPPGRRREIHRRLALRLSDPPERALHLALATEAANFEVAEELDRAADVARSRGALPVAARLQEEAARVTPVDDPETAARRTLAAANFWVDASDHRRAAALAEPLVAQLQAGSLHVDALVTLARTTSDRTTVAALYERALAEVGEVSAQKVRVLFGLWSARLHAMDVPGARETATQAQAVAERAGAAEWLVLAKSMVGRIETWVLGISLGADVLRDALQLEDQTERVDAYEGPGVWLGWWHLAGDELPEARRYLEEQFRRAVEAGDDYSRVWLCYPLTELECRAGDFGAAKHYAELGYELAEELESPIRPHRAALRPGACPPARR